MNSTVCPFLAVGNSDDDSKVATCLRSIELIGDSVVQYFIDEISPFVLWISFSLTDINAEPFLATIDIPTSNKCIDFKLRPSQVYTPSL